MKLSKVFTVIIYLLVIVVVLGLVGMLVVYLNNGQKSFYLQSGSDKIYTDNEQYVFVLDDYNVFYVKNSLGLTDKQEKDIDYSVQVVLNPSTFAKYGYTSYEVGFNLYSIEESDVKGYFNFIQEGNRFLLSLNSNATMEDLLMFLYSSAPLIEYPNVDLFSDNFLTLVITNNTDETSIRLGIVREVQE